MVVRRPSKCWFIIDFKDWTLPRPLPAPARQVEPVAGHEEKSRLGVKRHRNTDLGLTLVIMVIIDHGDHDDHGDPGEHGEEDDHDVGVDLAKNDQHSNVVKY